MYERGKKLLIKFLKAYFFNFETANFCINEQKSIFKKINHFQYIENSMHSDDPGISLSFFHF